MGGPKIGHGGVGLHNMYGGGLGMHPFMNPSLPRMQTDLNMLGQHMAGDLFARSLKMNGNTMAHPMSHPMPMGGNMSNQMSGNAMSGNAMSGNINSMTGPPVGGPISGNTML